MQTLKSILFLLLLATGVQAQNVNTLSIPDMTGAEGSSITLPVSMGNTSADVVAIQFNLSVPSNVLTLDVNDINLTERCADHEVVASMTGDGMYKVMIYSPTNEPFKANSGEIVGISVAVSDDVDEDTEYALALSDVVISDSKGQDVGTGFSNGTFRIRPSADFTVTDINTREPSAMPGDTIDVAWTMHNIGNMTSTGGWSERLSLVSAGGEVALGTFHNDTQTLQAGASMSRSVRIALSPYLGIDGDVDIKVEITPNSDSGEDIAYQKNNTLQTGNTPLNIGKLLYLTLPENIEEGATSTFRCSLTRSGSWNDDQTFDLAMTAGDTRLIVPGTVTIPRGQASEYFYINVTDNDVLDDDSLFTIQASGNGYEAVSSRFTVVDDEYPQLTISASKSEITEGESFSLTITTQRASAGNITVNLMAEQPKRFSFSPSVTIPAGETSATIDVTATDNDELELQESIAFKAVAERHVDGECIILLNDNDLPTIEMELSPASVAESAGTNAIIAKIKRTTNTDKKTTIQLSDDSDGDIYYPTRDIVMEAGEDEVQFSLGVTDNADAEGSRIVNITAAVYVSSCDCAATGTSVGVVSKAVEIIDDDGPALTLTAQQSTLLEGDDNGATLTVSRNTTTDNALTVNITSDYDEGLDYEHTVTIPAGAESVDVNVKANGNDTSGDGRTVVFTVETADYAKGTCWMMLTDQTMPDATIKAISLSATEAKVGESVEVTLTVANIGVTELPELTQVNIYMESSSEPVSTIYMQQALPAGGEAAMSKTITLPKAVGLYEIYAVANDDRKVAELLYVNNTSDKAEVNVIAPYTVSAAAGKTVYKQGEDIEISGNIAGDVPADTEVEVYVIYNGYRHVINVKADAQGLFTTTYKPYAGQIGHFTVGACYPGEGITDGQSSFDIYGLKQTTSTPVTCETLVGQPYGGILQLNNPGTLPLTDVRVSVVSKPDNCNVDVSCPNTIAGGGSADISYSITSLTASSGSDWEQIKLKVETAEGASLSTTIYYYSRHTTGKLKADVENINTTMNINTGRDYPIVITNTGKGESGKISLALPSWMTAATPTEMASLAYGDSATVVLRFRPTNDMQLNVPVTGKLGINCENGEGLSIGYRIEPVSDITGNLVIDVCDENTYYTAEAPHVSGAEVIVKHPTTGAVITQGLTDGDGLFTTTLPEGYYAISVTADRHDSYRNNILVSPGEETRKTVNLSFQAITIDWNVEETEIEDEYRIETTVEFETNVPVPVVELSAPSRIAADDLRPGESLIFYATLTNKGLITAKDVELLLPEGFTTLTFEALEHADGPFNLAPQQSVTIPVLVTKTAVASAASRKAAREKPIDNDPCAGQMGTLYFWDCGLDRKWHRYGIALQVGSCDSNDPSTWGGGNGGSGGGGLHLQPVPHTGFGGSNYGSSTGYKGVSTTDKGCEPCQNQFLLDLIKCGARFVPGLGQAMTVVETAGDVYNGIKDGAECVESFKNNDDLIKKLEECPFTEDYAGPMQLLQSLNKLLDAIAKGDYSDATLTDEEKAALNAAFDNAVDDIMDYVKEGLKEEALNLIEKKYPSVKKVNDKLNEVKEKTERIIEKGKNVVEKAEDLSQTDREKIGDVLNSTCELTAAIGEMMVETGIMEEVGETMQSVSKKVNKYGCLLNLVNYKCEKEGTQAARSLTISPRIEGINNSAIDAFVESASPFIYALQADDNIRSAIFGDEAWNDVTIGELVPLYYYLTNTDRPNYSPLRYILKPQSISYEQFDKLLERWQQLFNTANGYQDLIDLDNIKQQYSVIGDAAIYLEESGFENYTDLLVDRYYSALNDEASNSVCSSITLKFTQTMTMTRQAFRGTLTVFNGNEEKAMEDVRLNLEVRGEDGTLTTAHEFQINAESLNGFTGELNLTDGWTLAANEIGTATILFIPTKYAALEADKDYSFGGSLTYVDPFTGLVVTRDLFPVTLTVKPSPELDLTYFMQRDVYGDDALTKDVVEKSEPAEFALLITNKGYGDATDVKMVTEQPQIVENEKGLMIDFELISSQLNGRETTLALGGNIATEFGTIPARSQAYAQWWLQSSLLGHFTDYDVKATHVTSYGNEDLSLLDNVTIHELVRGFTVDDSGETPTRGFLVNDIVDAEDMPDMVYFTDGRVEESVSTAATAEITRINDTEYNVTVAPATGGWTYGSTADPTAGRQKIISVVRQSDGKTLPEDNFWTTDRTLRDGKDPLYEYRLHFAVNTSATETYVLTFEPRPAVELEVERFDSIPDDGTVMTSQLKEVGVKFNKPIVASTFTKDDITLNCQGVQTDLSQAAIRQVSDTEYVISLGEATIESGYYVLTVMTDGITDSEGFAGYSGKNTSWTQYIDGKVAVELTASPEEGGKVSPVTGRFEYGKEISLKATPAEGYEFAGWMRGNELLADSPELDYTPLTDDRLTAMFTLKHFNVNITYDASRGTVENASTGIYEYGTVLNLTAAPYEGYRFDGWTADGKTLGTDASYELTVNDDIDITALFVDDTPTAIASTGQYGQGDIKISPLPLGDVMHISGDFDKVKQLLIVDISGAVRLSATDIPNGTAVSLTSLPQGIYIIRIATDGSLFTKKAYKK